MKRLQHRKGLLYSVALFAMLTGGYLCWYQPTLLHYVYAGTWLWGIWILQGLICNIPMQNQFVAPIRTSHPLCFPIIALILWLYGLSGFTQIAFGMEPTQLPPHTWLLPCISTVGLAICYRTAAATFLKQRIFPATLLRQTPDSTLGLIATRGLQSLTLIYLAISVSLLTLIALYSMTNTVTWNALSGWHIPALCIPLLPWLALCLKPVKQTIHTVLKHHPAYAGKCILGLILLQSMLLAVFGRWVASADPTSLQPPTLWLHALAQGPVLWHTLLIQAVGLCATPWLAAHLARQSDGNGTRGLILHSIVPPVLLALAGFYTSLLHWASQAPMAVFMSSAGIGGSYLLYQMFTPPGLLHTLHHGYVPINAEKYRAPARLFHQVSVSGALITAFFLPMGLLGIGSLITWLSFFGIALLALMAIAQLPRLTRCKNSQQPPPGEG